MSATMTFTGALTILHCCKCSMAFGVPQRFEQDRRSDHESFYCPAGHPQYFPQKSDNERLAMQLEQERARANQLNDRVAMKDRQLRARKAVTTRLRNRIAKGKCPCCKAQFADLERHMRHRHPGWSPDREALALSAKAAEKGGAA